MSMRTFVGFLLFIILRLLFTSGLIQAQAVWENIGPGGGSDLQASAVDPGDANIVYIGGDIEGVFKTTDGGHHWRSINNNLASGPWTADVYWINQIAFDPGDATHNTLYLCTSVGLFKSINGGDHWQLFFPTTISSEDDFVEVQSIAVDPDNSRIVFVGGTGKGLYRTSDGGATFSAVNVEMDADSSISDIFIDPLSDPSNRTIYLGTMAGVFKSADNGVTWTAVNSGLPHKQVWNLKGLVFQGKTKLFATLVTRGSANTFQGGIFSSDDGARHWKNISGNLPKVQSEDNLLYYYWKFSVNPLNPKTIYIGTSLGYPDESSAAYEDWGVYKTINGGVDWTRVDRQVALGWMDDTFFNERYALVLEMAPSDTNVVYWGRDWMNRTLDGGTSWDQIYTEKSGPFWIGHGLELMMAESMTFAPDNPNHLFVGYDDMGPFLSQDNGTSFRPLDVTMDPYDGYDAAKDIEIDPENGDIYMSRYDGMGSEYESNFSLGQVWKSVDDGGSWNKISNGLPDGRPDLALDRHSGSPEARILYCASYGNGVYKSLDSGEHWTAINSGLGPAAAYAWEIVLNPNNSSELYLGLNNFGNGGGLYKSTDAGESWTRQTSFPDQDILCLRYGNNNNLIYAGATENFDWSISGGLYKSADGGNSWQKIFDHPRIVAVEIHPLDSNILFAASQTWYAVWLDDISPGVYASQDGGKTWNNITGNLGNTFVTFLKLSPGNPDELFAGTGGGGVWVNRHAVTAVRRNKNEGAAGDFRLCQNYPNPFNSLSTIEFSVAEEGPVVITVHNNLGQLVATLAKAVYQPGLYSVRFNNSTNLPSGVYLYRIRMGDFSATKKMVLLE